ncbi:MAG: 5-(carboxyamino)imidazole ribonucleotide synthase [Gammaproteobacteria bacterium]|nr:5-(carboxyamino)imidazole ribonucleotide synthase [Gammaproteobacteria bacterium]
MVILPGNTLGMLGGGQLGRMFVAAARTMGYEVIVFDPDANSPAGKMASKHLEAPYSDRDALDYMVQHCAAISTEFENIPADTLEYLAQFLPVHPSASALRIAQNRVLEKNYFSSQGLNTAPYLAIDSQADIAAANGFEFPAILKTATLGYDGKGQVICESVDEVLAIYKKIDGRACILEKKIDLAKEVSVVLCRSESGDIDCFPIAENEHARGILDISMAPADLSQSLAHEVRQAACRIAEGLDYCGVLAVEFFISNDNQVLVNEMAPRPHNSGHYTLDACETSQFEQQVRMMCGLPAGSSRQHTAVAMWNLLGDIWPQDGVPRWDEVMQQGRVKLHLYGKTEARAGRKMGHINCLAGDTGEARQLLAKIKHKLSPA